MFDTTKLVDLERFMLDTFPGEAALKKESARKSSNPIFNASVESVDRADRDQGVARYTSTNHLLTLYMKKGREHLNFAKQRAALDVSIGISGAMMGSDRAGDEEVHLLVMGGRYLLTGSLFQDQTGHSDFGHGGEEPWILRSRN